MEIVQKIDRKFLSTASYKDLQAAIVALLGLIEELSTKLQKQEEKILALTNELLLLKGEKKSLFFQKMHRL